MTDFIVSITEPAHLDGITWARDAHNVEAEQLRGEAPEYRPDMPFIETDDGYVQWVMERAAASYAQQQALAPLMPPPPEAA